MAFDLYSLGFYSFVYPMIVFFIAIYIILRLLPFLKDKQGKFTGKSSVIAVLISVILSLFVVTYTPFGRFASSVLVLLIMGLIIWAAYKVGEKSCDKSKNSSISTGSWVPYICSYSVSFGFWPCGEIDEGTWWGLYGSLMIIQILASNNFE